MWIKTDFKTKSRINLKNNENNNKLVLYKVPWYVGMVFYSIAWYER